MGLTADAPFQIARAQMRRQDAITPHETSKSYELFLFPPAYMH